MLALAKQIAKLVFSIIFPLVVKSIMPLEMSAPYGYSLLAAMSLVIYMILCFVEAKRKLGGQDSLCLLKLEAPTPHKPPVDQFLLGYRGRIRDAIQEDFSHIFLRKIQDLYLKLEERSIRMPSLRPFVDSARWCNYHIRFLKDLEMQIAKIEDGASLDLEQWNNQVLNIEKDRNVYMGEATNKGLLNDLELQMLKVIYDQLRELDLVTTSNIYTHKLFLKTSPIDLSQSFIHLKDEGYIVATRHESANPLSSPSTRRSTVHRIADKGRKAIQDSS